jgi:hypothetical protein
MFGNKCSGTSVRRTLVRLLNLLHMQQLCQRACLFPSVATPPHARLGRGGGGYKGGGRSSGLDSPWLFVLFVCLCTQLDSGRVPHTLPDDCPRAFAPGLVGHRLSQVPSSWRYTSSGCWQEYTFTISPLVLSHLWSGCTITGQGD